MKAKIEQMRAEWKKKAKDFEAQKDNIGKMYCEILLVAADEILALFKPCVWTLADHGGYETGCGLNTDLSPDHPKMKYCPYCGNEIIDEKDLPKFKDIIGLYATGEPK